MIERKAASKTWDDDNLYDRLHTLCITERPKPLFKKKKKRTLGCTIWTPSLWILSTDRCIRRFNTTHASSEATRHLGACEEESVVSITKDFSGSILTAPALLALVRALTNIDQSVLFCGVGRLPERASSVCPAPKPCFFKCSV